MIGGAALADVNLLISEHGSIVCRRQQKRADAGDDVPAVCAQL
jgi:hypothetical protein